MQQMHDVLWQLGARNNLKLDGGSARSLYYNDGTGHYLYLGSGITEPNAWVVVPNNSPPPTGNWTARYDQGDTCWWDTSTGCIANPRCTETITGPELHKNWGSGAPCGGMNGDNWIGDFRATLNFPSGDYVFQLDHDDGAKLWLNGQNIQDRGGSGSGPVCPARHLSGDTQLRVLLREEGGDARINLTWTDGTGLCQPPGAFNKSGPANRATGQATNLNLNWGSSSGATGYEYCYDTTTDNPCGGSWTGVGASNSVGLSGLSSGTTYYWQVRARNAGGTTTDADGGTWWSFTTQVPAPSAPTNVQASDGTHTDKVQVTWNASSGATSYEVWRNTSNNSGSATQLASSVSGTSYDDTTAVVGTTYYYWVKAKSAGGTSGFSSSDSGYRNGTPPLAPTNVQASDGTYADKVQVTWSTSSGATSYEVWRNTSNNSGSATQLASSVSGTSYDDTTAVAGTTYYYWVKAKNTYGTSGFSGSDSGYRNTEPTNQVKLYSLANFGGSVVWQGTSDSNGPNADSYSLEIPSGWSVKVYDQDNYSGTERCWNSSVNNLQDHSWHLRIQSIRVYSYDACLPSLPGGFDKNSPANGATGQATNPSLSWGSSSGATSYEYYCYSTTNAGDCDASWVNVGTNTSATLSGLNSGTTYYWQVRARNVAGTTDANDGAWWSFTTQEQPTASLSASVAPNPVAMNSGEFTAVTYTFNENAGTGVHIAQRTARFTLLDGTTYVSDPLGPYANDIGVPAGGSVQWIDYVYLPPEVVSNARAHGASAVLLRTTFSGQDAINRPASVQSDLRINLAGAGSGSVQILKTWTSSVCALSAQQKTQFLPGETAYLIIQANNLESFAVDTKWTWLVKHPDGSTDNVYTDFPVSMEPGMSAWCSSPYSVPSPTGVYTFTGKITWNDGVYQDLESATFEVVGEGENKVFLPLILK